VKKDSYVGKFSDENNRKVHLNLGQSVKRVY
jgi:hypothetical protein